MPHRRRYSNDELNQIYDRTSGKCHLCHKKVAFKNYGAHGARGAWHVEHSRPLAKGGTDRMSNLYAACISCNLQKHTFTTRTARSWVDKTKAPLSRERREGAKQKNAVGGGVIGAGLGAAFAGPPGALVGAIVGAIVGHSQNPDV